MTTPIFALQPESAPMTYDLIIRNGTIVTASDTFAAEIAIRDGKIEVVASHIEAEAKRVIDAKGLLVMPGGIDSHVHLAQDIGGGPALMADGFESGTRSALAGGTTTVIPFAQQPRGWSLRAAIDDYHARASGQSYVDYGFHMIITDPTPEVLREELPALVAEGYSSFKIFMTYEAMVLNDRQILEVMEVAGECKALVMVHCEGYDAIRFMTEKLERAGKTRPFYHGVSRPQSVEREATHRAISHAELTDVPVMIVHVSGREPMEQIRWAQNRGMNVLAETCPQYIALTADDMRGQDEDGMDGAKYVCSPPPRDHASWDAIWEGLKGGIFQTFSSDHSPYLYESETGKLSTEAKSTFKYVPNGIPAVETRMAVLFSRGVSEGRINLNEFVALTSTNHAKIYGLYPQKGSIAPGFDADIVLWDPERVETISQSLMHHGCDYTPFEGQVVKGWPVMTILRGTVACENGEILMPVGEGKFLPRSRSSAWR